MHMVGGATVCPMQSRQDYNSQAWRAKWSDVKHTAAPQHSQLENKGVYLWKRIADHDYLTLHLTPAPCGGTLYIMYTQLVDAKNNRPIISCSVYGVH